ncbi:hypothetical protein [Mesorhizobium sp. B1-1-5]|uniref:hypothetical protein n=1 Tax=Mesorhizobium sp. B1-1-5 TaxID=2589979 RepID=UPI0015E383E4|nr:hypothetical protein [Mesorhizobium sp. B1-1-5]
MKVDEFAEHFQASYAGLGRGLTAIDLALGFGRAASCAKIARESSASLLFLFPTTEPPTVQFGRSFAGDIGRSIADVRGDSRELNVRGGIHLPGVLGSFRISWVAPQPELRVLMDKMGHWSADAIPTRPWPDEPMQVAAPHN